MSKLAAKSPCPCHSSRAYGACCRPYHVGEALAPTPEALMRSRFAAFAAGLGDYLVDTLASTHDDLATPREALARALSRARETQRFMNLCIMHTSIAPDGARGEVLFYARIFEFGVDCSFAELSQFVREPSSRGLAWRYESGELVPKSALPPAPETLTRAAFLALSGGSRE